MYCQTTRSAEEKKQDEQRRQHERDAQREQDKREREHFLYSGSRHYTGVVSINGSYTTQYALKQEAEEEEREQQYQKHVNAQRERDQKALDKYFAKLEQRMEQVDRDRRPLSRRDRELRRLETLFTQLEQGREREKIAQQQQQRPVKLVPWREEQRHIREGRVFDFGWTDV